MVDDPDRVDRDTHFEKNDAYKNFLIDLTRNEERDRLVQRLKDKNNAFLIQAKDSVPQFLSDLLKTVPYRDSIGKYILYRQK